MTRAWIRPACCALLLALGTPPGAASQPLPAPGGPEWQPLRFRRVERATRYEALPRPGPRGARAISECAAAGLVLPVEGAPGRKLSWRWRISRPLPPHEERSRAGDDFAARVYVMFRFDPGRAGAWERARRRLARIFYGAELPGSAIAYVWSTREPAGSAWESPYGGSWLVSRGSGPLPEWRREQVDPAADYRRLYQQEPPELLGIGIMTDADDTCGHAIASYAEFEWLEAGGGAGSPGE